MFDSFLLVHELQAAGLPVTNADSDGKITYSRALTDPEQTLETSIKAAHKPNARAQEEADRRIIIQQRLDAANTTINGKDIVDLTSSDVHLLLLIWLAERGWLTAEGKIYLP
jgi:hypothetical protein